MNISNFRIKPILWLLICASFILSGCVQYDLGINFNNANNGEIIQHIQLSDQLTSFSSDYISEWLNSLERRARKLEGSARRISPEEILLKIPFSNGRELQEKFSGFFNYSTSQKPETVSSDSELPNITSNLLVQNNNFLLLSRNRLIYDLDLRSLSVLTSKGNALTGTASIINLDFSLQTPWGVKNIQQTEDEIQPEKNGQQLIWKLKPGELNHIEVVFWLPNMLGIGTLIIILFVWGGFYLRYTLLADIAVLG
ncbi:DUF3153 domain-containing protein [Anabaena cylindrica FACHB-243]|uniref:DUF3153 domain-containing protein n=1 Tax=Anabaena cylindrica (strain ATCC 27899 / PCC 7122) TaxID=272123 RepID=K9ZJ49_ANACC|nr:MULTISPECIES: DUF3153 domain-containing protein [Anabaena]AFZ58375.1 hypothetical protein Anacy_2953 [Anabaena cylindrica PCC 7122]MBD2416970.1 DUF3153 domain-containing protein [Anabaena cylindrica FACHB-243]MBY5284223.1 DUF3153 domain-containing protein [Anabaena sp. CCAP 1446/1C]MBY5308806.1 DUF3153 domain-containing protein [Anabaena sp. CCAP 1446/1C]MCM2406504.1 DUF3153 domain-containing protein [Anabaena sp. CCAP 1446/1C]